jgi:hypothetical protein
MSAICFPPCFLQSVDNTSKFRSKIAFDRINIYRKDTTCLVEKDRNETLKTQF